MTTSTDSDEPVLRPQPSWFLVALSLLLLVKIAIVMGWSSILLFGPHQHYMFQREIALLVLVVLLIVGLNQLLGTFRAWPYSALGVAVALLLSSVVTGLGIGDALLRNRLNEPGEGSALAIQIGYLSFLAWGTYLNFAWSIRLILEKSPALPVWRFSFTEFLAAFAVLAAGFGGASYELRSIPAEWGVYATPTEVPYPIPAKADRVFFSGIRGSRAIEFEVAEAEFLAWLQERSAVDERFSPDHLRTDRQLVEIVRFTRFRFPDRGDGIARTTPDLYLEDTSRPGSKLQIAYDRVRKQVYFFETWDLSLESSAPC